MTTHVVCSACGIFNCDCEELQKYAEIAAWDRFKKEVSILKGYKFKEDQLMHYIRMTYEIGKM